MKIKIVVPACMVAPSARKKTGQPYLLFENIYYQKQLNRQIFSGCNSPNRLPEFSILTEHLGNRDVLS